jgi:hypothetical protein
MTEQQIKHMTERFLAWRLPDNFLPDAGISFTPDYNGTDFPLKHQPTGTNLFDYTQAKAMIEHLVEGLDATAHPDDRVRAKRHALRSIRALGKEPLTEKE